MSDIEGRNPDLSPIERGQSPIRLEYQYKDHLNRNFGTFQGTELVLANSTNTEATIFDGSIETPYGTFMLECVIPEAEKAVQNIKEYLKLKDELKAVNHEHEQASINMRSAADRMRSRGDDQGYFDARTALDGIKTRRDSLEIQTRVMESLLSKYRI